MPARRTIPNVPVPLRRSAIALLFLSLLASVARAQQYTPPPPPLTTGPCKPTKDYPCTPLPASTTTPAPTKFPFPGDTPDPTTPNVAKPTPAEQFPFPGDAPSNPTSGHAPAQTPAQPSAAQKFPFPEDAPTNTAPAATPAQPSAAQKFPSPDDTSNTSTSSSSSSSASDPSDPTPDPDKPIADKGSYGSTRASRRRKLPVPEDLDQREATDLEVSHYYATTGNLQGSYLRAQDAVKTIPDDPLAHFALAESALALKKTDEAIAEYKLYLKLDPEGEKVKAAQRALAALSPK